MNTLVKFATTGKVGNKRKLQRQVRHLAAVLRYTFKALTVAVERAERHANEEMDGEYEQEWYRWYMTGYAHGKIYAAQQMGHTHNAILHKASDAPQ